MEAEARLLRAEGRPEFIAAAPAMQPVLQTIARIGPSDANVLVTGEHGTGKEVVAQTLHALSARASMPLVAVNTGALPEGTFESELFGHVKGAFTDARTDRIGRFELADNGTIFLDEIGNVPIRQQAKLLRVLETGEIERVGSSRTKRVNVRVISATNISLQEAIAAGNFAKIYCSASTLSRSMCPPCASAAKIFPRLPRTSCRVMLPAIVRQSPDSPRLRLQAMMQYAWPGNVRELEHTLERAVLMCHTDEIQVSDLGLNVQQRAQGQNLRRAQYRRGRGHSGSQGPATLSRQCEPGGGGAGSEPRRALSPHGTLWTLARAGDPTLSARTGSPALDGYSAASTRPPLRGVASGCSTKNALCCSRFWQLCPESPSAPL